MPKTLGTMTISELLEILDGIGIVVTDETLVDETLKEHGLSPSFM